MKRFKNIVFLADRDKGLSASLDRAVDIAKTNGARLTVMDVTAEIGLADYIQRTYSVDLNAQLKERRLQFLERLTQPYTDRGVPVYTTVATGIPFIEIIRAVQRNQHDLVMKVAEHDSGLVSSLFGSTDMHLMRKCPCPVWIDRAGDEPAYQRILAAVDPFDDESGNLQRLILDLATSLSEHEHATLDVMHAWEMPGESMLANGRARIPRTELDLLLEATETSHREALDALLSAYGLSAGSSNVHLLKGRPAQIISAYAREQEHDLIVMGTLGRAGIAGLFIGNTAEDVLREAQTAVLTVKPNGFVTPIA
jgi:nucleotide-binding universal stress UspA family protein